MSIQDFNNTAVVGKRLACRLGMWKRARKVKGRQGDVSVWGGNFVAKTSFKVRVYSSVLGKFVVDAEV